MCDHASDAEARRCQCTGYGLGDPRCRCGRGKSHHEDGVGRCLIASARCHEFVLRLYDPLPVTDQIIAAAVAAVTGLGVSGELAGQVVIAALAAGREEIVRRDFDMDSLRRDRDRLRAQLDEMIRAAQRAPDVPRTGSPLDA